MKKAFLSIGSNRGDKKKNLGRAVRYINVSMGQIIDLSGIYESEPWGFESNENFLNMVVEIFTDLRPQELLKNCMEIELKLGRVRKDGEGYASRTIDIDILLYADEVIDEENLKIPHPLIHERKFVLEPLAEIAPTNIHPVLGISIKDLLQKCKDESFVTQLGSITY